MAGLGIDGLASGLDTTSIINQLMTLEARPQTALKTTLTSTTAFANDLRALNSQIAGLATLAKTDSGATALSVFRATSSAPSVSATAGTSATPGSISFTVDKVAKSQVVVTKAMTAWESTPPVLTIVAADGTQKEFTAKSTSVADVAAAINSAGAGVTASAVAAGTDTNGVPQYRLQLTASASGAKGAFTIYRGTAANIGSSSVDLAEETGAAKVSGAQDAQVTLWGGTSAAQQITSATNTFADMLPGLSVTVTAPEAALVTVSTAQDGGGATAVASKLFTSLIGIFSGIADKSTVTKNTSGTGVKAGVYVGDSGVREVKDALLRAATDPIDDTSLSSIGIKLTRDGTIEFDSAAFAAALQKDPTGTASAFQTVASRLAAAATGASDATKGYLTAKVAGQDKAVTSLGDQIAAWDLRLATRRDTIQKQYNALETALSSMKSQSDWLASQLGSLMTKDSSK